MAKEKYRITPEEGKLQREAPQSATNIMYVKANRRRSRDTDVQYRNLWPKISTTGSRSGCRDGRMSLMADFDLDDLTQFYISNFRPGFSSLERQECPVERKTDTCLCSITSLLEQRYTAGLDNEYPQGLHVPRPAHALRTRICVPMSPTQPWRWR